MNGKHIALVAGCLVGLSAIVSTLADWHQALNPTFVGGALGVVGAQLGAIYSERP